MFMIEEIGYVEELRQRLGVNKDDTSKDEYIVSLSPFRRLELLCGWFLGDEMWAYTFKEYCESQGLTITNTLTGETI